MKRALAGSLYLCLALMIGCHSSNATTKIVPIGTLPAGARLVGGGTYQGLTFPVDGLLLVVDPKTRVIGSTISVEARKPIEMEQEHLYGILMAQSGIAGAKQFSNSVSNNEAVELSRDPLIMQLYFVPMSDLKLTTSDTAPGE